MGNTENIAVAFKTKLQETWEEFGSIWDWCCSNVGWKSQNSLNIITLGGPFLNDKILLSWGTCT